MGSIIVIVCAELQCGGEEEVLKSKLIELLGFQFKIRAIQLRNRTVEVRNGSGGE